MPVRELDRHAAAKYAARILANVTIVASPEHVQGPCMIWQRSRTYSGAPQMTVLGTQIGSDRAAYIAFVGPIPVDPETGRTMQLHRTCGSQGNGCVAPAHAEPVTQAENLRRQKATRTHCGKGHEFTDENTYLKPSNPGRRGGPTRVCLTCRRTADQKYLQRRAAAARSAA